MLELSDRAGRKKIISFIHYILNSCAKSSPTLIPTKDINMEAEVGDYGSVFRFESELLEHEEVDEGWMTEKFPDMDFFFSR